MSAYIMRRLLYAIPILIGVNLITFVLFFVVNSPDDMARMQLGDKRVTEEAIDSLEGGARLRPAAALQRRGRGGWDKLTDTIFFQKSVKLFAFDFGSRTAAATSATTSASACGRAWPSRCRCCWSGSPSTSAMR
jgi:peptide/nickel transport system permease protein